MSVFNRSLKVVLSVLERTNHYTIKNQNEDGVLIIINQ